MHVFSCIISRDYFFFFQFYIYLMFKIIETNQISFFLLQLKFIRKFKYLNDSISLIQQQGNLSLLQTPIRKSFKVHIYIYTSLFSPLNRQVLKEHTQLLLLFSNTLNIVIFFIYKGNFYFSKQSFNICTNFLNPKHSAVFALVPRCRSFSPQQWQYCIISTYVMFFMQHLKGMWVSKTYVTYCGFLWGMGNEGERERYLYLIIYLGVGGKIMFIVSEQFYVGWRQIDV
eukprot:TRINITY_DN11524_c0_g1_i10.p2 TRINITY_DN11524_c0_g1~~TRINITY_DN11524_c0_g1_i10.p2  ORF type:complete len:228 (-),score=-10.27 TRINITY_DN11524_c0_g1_i10:225-908(-)